MSSVDLINNQVTMGMYTDFSVEYFEENGSTITHLRLIHSEVDTETLVQILRLLPNLESMELYNINTETIKYLFDLNYFDVPMVIGLHNLKSLIISTNKINTLDVTYFEKIASLCPKLIKFKAINNEFFIQITQTEFTNFLKKCYKTLKVLHITDEIADEIFRFDTFKIHGLKLTELYIDSYRTDLYDDNDYDVNNCATQVIDNVIKFIVTQKRLIILKLSTTNIQTYHMSSINQNCRLLETLQIETRNPYHYSPCLHDVNNSALILNLPNLTTVRFHSIANTYLIANTFFLNKNFTQLKSLHFEVDSLGFLLMSMDYRCLPNLIELGIRFLNLNNINLLKQIFNHFDKLKVLKLVWLQNQVIYDSDHEYDNDLLMNIGQLKRLQDLTLDIPQLKRFNFMNKIEHFQKLINVKSIFLRECHFNDHEQKLLVDSCVNLERLLFRDWRNVNRNILFRSNNRRLRAPRVFMRA